MLSLVCSSMAMTSAALHLGVGPPLYKSKGAYLPGDSTAVLRDVSFPEPGVGQVLVKTMASTICGSDIRCIYKQHVGHGAEGYKNKIVGHEPAGRIVATGERLKRFKVGDRVVVYHISGCGCCRACRSGYMIGCENDHHRASYGFQRDGGMSEFVMCDEKDLISLPDELSYTDGAQIACGFGTVFEGLDRIAVSGKDSVLVTGLGPVGLACAMVAKKMGAQKLVGVDISRERCDLALSLKLVDAAFVASSDEQDMLQKLRGETYKGLGFEKAVDCSASPSARALCIRALRTWGSMNFIGEGGSVTFDPSDDCMHKQATLYGSWVTSIGNMEKLVELCVRWDLHPDSLVTHAFGLDDVAEAYQTAAAAKAGKVAVAFDEEFDRLKEQIESNKLA